MAKKTVKKQAITTSPLKAWLNQHRNSIQFSTQRLWLNPVSTWMTLAVIALALALPTGLHILLKNLSTIATDQREIPTISLFLKPSVSEQQAADRAELFTEMPEISAAHLVSKDEAVDNFKNIKGFAEILETLGENPLPHVIIITPELTLLGNVEMDMDSFSKTLKNFPEVDDVQIDLEWVQRLRAIINIAERITLVIAILLGITVLLVVGNTIRLNISSKKDEIEIIQLIGATNRYIRRPFLYEGVWYGFFGGIFSLVIVHFSLLFLVTPVETLASLYNSKFVISGVGITIMLKIILASALLGLVGAWIAVGRHLHQYNPTR
jgi:cell division transport system permease protein